MIRLVRWAVSVSLLQGMMLIVLAWLVPGFELALAPGIALVGFIFTVSQLVAWPLLYRVSTRIHPLIFPLLSLILSGALVVLVADQLLMWDIATLKVSSIWTGIAITLGLTFSYTLFGSLFSLRDLDAYDWFVTRRLRRTFRQPDSDGQDGFIFLEIDGLSAPLLARAMDDGWMPHLADLYASGAYTLQEWETDLSSQTSASQAGILLGSNEGIPAFRWYDKPEGQLRVSSSFATARDLEHKLSNGQGLLTGGASRWNVFSGDAPDSFLTYSTLGARDRGGSTSYLGLFASPYGIGRVMALYIGDVIRERWQAHMQRYRDVQPRVRRSRRYAVVRAATTTLMLEMAQFALLADMYRGIKRVYCTVFAYDEVAHHSGIDSIDAMKVLTRIDTMIGVLQKEMTNAARPYQLVILSDHGQSMGPTFRQRNDQTLGEVVRSLVDSAANVSVQDALLEDDGYIQLTLQQLLQDSTDDRTLRVVQQAAKSFNRQLARLQSDEPVEPIEQSDVIVLASGNLGLISFPQVPGRMTYEEITEQYPLLLPGLLNHPDIGFVMVRSALDGGMILGSSGIYYLHDDAVAGSNPLEHYGPRAAHHLRRTDQFANAPDTLVMSATHPETGTVFAFEELVGSHGGLGGWQTRPFVFHPAHLQYPQEPVVGAGSLHKVLVDWVRSTNMDVRPDAETQNSLDERPAG